MSLVAAVMSVGILRTGCLAIILIRATAESERCNTEYIHHHDTCTEQITRPTYLYMLLPGS